MIEAKKITVLTNLKSDCDEFCKTSIYEKLLQCESGGQLEQYSGQSESSGKKWAVLAAIQAAESNQMSRREGESTSKDDGSRAHPGRGRFLRGSTWAIGPSKQVSKQSERKTNTIVFPSKNCKHFRHIHRRKINSNKFCKIFTKWREHLHPSPSTVLGFPRIKSFFSLCCLFSREGEGGGASSFYHQNSMFSFIILIPRAPCIKVGVSHPSSLNPVTESWPGLVITKIGKF